MTYHSIVYHKDTKAIRQMTNSLRVLQKRDAANGYVLLRLGSELRPLLSQSSTHVTIRDGEVVGFVARGALPARSVPDQYRTFGPPPPESPSKVAVSALGDVIMSLPAVEEYSRRFDLGVTYITDSQMVEFLERQPFVERAVSGLRARYPVGRAIDLQKLGEAVPAGARLPRPEQYAHLLGVSLKIARMPNYLVSTPEEMLWAQQVVDDLRRPIVAMSPFSGHAKKNWGKELQLMSAMSDVTFVMVGKMPGRVDLPNVVQLAGRTTVTAMMAIVAQCDAAGFLDTGLMHVAGMLGVPYLAVFGGVHPSSEFTSLYPSVESIELTSEASAPGLETHPCAHCYLGKVHDCAGKPYEHWCMEGIGVEQVQDRLRDLLGGATPAVPPRTPVTEVAMVNTGGLGDLLVCVNTVRQLRPALVNEFGPVNITFFTRQDYSILRQFDFIDRWVFTEEGDTHRDVIPRILPSYDHVYHLQYGARLVTPATVRDLPLFEAHDPDVFIGHAHANGFGDLSYQDDERYLADILGGSRPNSQELAWIGEHILQDDEPYVVFANGTDPTFGQGQTKSLPKQRVAQIVGGIGDSGIRSVQVGTGEVDFLMGTKTVNAVGKTSLEGLIYVLEHSAGLLSIDNGVLHLAGQLKVPAMGIFGPTSPKFWGYPHAKAHVASHECEVAPCWLKVTNWHKSCAHNHTNELRVVASHCMNVLDAELVVEEFLDFLGLGD